MNFKRTPRQYKSSTFSVPILVSSPYLKEVSPQSRHTHKDNNPLAKSNQISK